MASPGSNLPRPLSAKYKGDFAYPTVKDRIPTILTKVIDTLHRQKGVLKEQHGEEGPHELKVIIGRLSKLRNAIQTDKIIQPLTDSLPDTDAWNKHLEQEREREGQDPSWFLSPWLYTECYFYRRIHEAIQLSSLLNYLDPFQQQKENALITSRAAILTLGKYLTDKLDLVKEAGRDKVKVVFSQLLKICLWGNKCDLSISAGRENSQTFNPVKQLDNLTSYLLHDDTKEVWNTLNEKDSGVRLDIVLDNAGFELFTDLCFAEFLLAAKVVSSVHFHAKCFPWFVSDVTPRDFEYTLGKLEKDDNDDIRNLASSWRERIADGSWVFNIHPFWTQNQDFSLMRNVAPDLYSELSKSDQILFKGDLNYRKLTGDLTWDSTKSFEGALQGFHPAPLCALRTIKCDLVVGLDPGQAEEAAKREDDWMLDGKFAVIHFCSSKS